MTTENTSATARVLLLVAAVGRVGTQRVSDLDLARLAYFVDAFSPLWGLLPLDRYRTKVDDVRSESVRRALNRLVFAGVIEPFEVHAVREGRQHLSARYSIITAAAEPIFTAIRSTHQGRREADLVEEVAYAAAGLLDGNLAQAVERDAAYGDPRLGPADLIDLGEEYGTTAPTARRFRRGTHSSAVEAELVHLYLGHLERAVNSA